MTWLKWILNREYCIRLLIPEPEDPGEIPGKGSVACRFVGHFFRLLRAKGVPTHYIETVSDNGMIVEPAIPLSMPVERPAFPGSAPLLNLEFTWRNNATGRSF